LKAGESTRLIEQAAEQLNVILRLPAVSGTGRSIAELLVGAAVARVTESDRIAALSAPPDPEAIRQSVQDEIGRMTNVRTKHKRPALLGGRPLDHRAIKRRTICRIIGG
jgi:hypothetical protein